MSDWVWVITGMCGGTITDEEHWIVGWFGTKESASKYLKLLNKQLKKLPEESFPRQDDEAGWLEPTPEGLMIAEVTMKDMDREWKGDWNRTIYTLQCIHRLGR